MECGVITAKGKVAETERNGGQTRAGEKKKAVNNGEVNWRHVSGERKTERDGKTDLKGEWVNGEEWMTGLTAR